MQLAGILVWWLLIVAMGLTVLPLTLTVFRFLPDRGYAFSKPAGLLLVGLVAWLIGFLHFSTITILGAAGLVGGFSFWLWGRKRDEFLAVLKERLGTIVVVELFFAALFLGFLFFRMYNPEVLGTEKFMDLAFMNAITRAPSFPPYDPWLAGPSFFISYYYFGYYFMALLTKLSAVPPAIAFNLSLGLLFALSGTAVFGLLYNLTQRLGAAFLGWAGIYLLGNLDGFRQVLTTRSLANFNWWTPSRVIPDTINEFPFFSFLLGDMHPHMLAVPFFLMALALALNHVRSEAREPWNRAPETLGRYVFWGLVIGSLGFINSWDLPTVCFVAIAALAAQQARMQARIMAWPWKSLLAVLGVLLAAASLPYLPFYFYFTSPAQGIAVTTQNTTVGEYLLIFGLFTFLGLTFLAARYHAWFVAILLPQVGKTPAAVPPGASLSCPQCGTRVRPGKTICGRCGFNQFTAAAGAIDSGLTHPAQELPGIFREVLLFVLQPVTYWKQRQPARAAVVVVVLVGLVVLAAVFKSVFLGLIVLLLAAVAVLAASRIDQAETTFALMVLFTGWLLVFGAEVLHIRDTFDPPLDRMNTVFKFYYQAWFLLGIGGVYGAWWAWTRSFRHHPVRVAWLAPLVLLVAASLVYPYAAVKIKTNGFMNQPTLDGSLYLSRNFPADREGIEWLRHQATGTPVVLEATGGEYTDFARVSTFTGLPTVLGWGGHELQWRGNYDEPGRRIPAIDTLYTSADLDQVKRLLEEYRIEYVFVGTLEREKYPAAGLEKFGKVMNLAFETPGGGVRIYRRR